jgi:hypothetical protein
MVTGLDIGPNDEIRGVNTYFGIIFGAKVPLMVWVGARAHQNPRGAAMVLAFVQDRWRQLCCDAEPAKVRADTGVL